MGIRIWEMKGVLESWISVVTALHVSRVRTTVQCGLADVTPHKCAVEPGVSAHLSLGPGIQTSQLLLRAIFLTLPLCFLTLGGCCTHHC